MFSSYGKREWLAIIFVSLVIAGVAGYFHWWWLIGLVIIAAAALLSFFRDPDRKVPSQKGVMVSPADGRISSIHHIENYEPLGGPAWCVRVLLYVTDVHVNRSPCHGFVQSITHKPGEFLNALNPKSAEVNESNLIVLTHAVKRTPVAAVRQVSGAIARRIVCGTRVGETLQRGQRIGMIKFGSTTELYVPDSLRPEVVVRQGQYVWGGETVLMNVNPAEANDAEPGAATGDSPAA